MSANIVNRDFWQSTARSTIRERCESIFNQELLSDVRFVIRNHQGGSKNKNIPAHKFVLAISSPVFYAMFYGELAATKDSVEIFDCEYESVLEMFRFIYSDEANLTPDNVMQLMYLAKKYMLPSLADKCSAYLQQNVDASNVFHVLPEAQKYEEEELLGHCWKLVEDETEEAVESEDFTAIERSVLEELVENDALNIEEVALFKAVDSWAKHQCKKQGLAAEGPVKRSILGERIVKGIRFPVMQEKEFASVVLDSDILTKDESYHLVKYFNSVLNTSVSFCGWKRARECKIITRFEYVLRKGWHYPPIDSKVIHPQIIGLSVSEKVELRAVRFFGSDSSEHSVTLTLKDGRGRSVATERGNFFSKSIQSEIGSYPGFEIAFRSPIILKAKSYYKFVAKITGPSSTYGEGGCSVVNKGGILFFFVACRRPTTLQRGQFSEFVFGLH